MKSKLKLSEPALADIKAILSFYAADGQDLRKEFMFDFRDAANSIQSFPEAWPEMDGIRRKLMGRFPYAVLFSIEDGYISLLRVFHTSRQPGSWKK